MLDFGPEDMHRSRGCAYYSKLLSGWESLTKNCSDEKIKNTVMKKADGNRKMASASGPKAVPGCRTLISSKAGTDMGRRPDQSREYRHLRHATGC